MIGNIIHLLNPMLSGQSVYEVIFEMSPIVQLNSVWSAMLPQDVPFDTKDHILDSDVRSWVCLQQTSGCLHNCQHNSTCLGGFVGE